MNEQLKFLIELQEVDSVIITMAERIELVPKEIIQFYAPLKEAKESQQKASAKCDVLNKKKKEKDMQLDDIQDKIAKLKARSSSIKTNKEYEAHLKEIEVFEKQVYQAEDEILVLMEEIEVYSKKLKEEGLKLKAAEEDYKKHEAALAEEQQKLQAELEVQKARRKEFASKIKKEHYDQYMILLKRLGDKAVVEVKNEICLGCHTNIPPQLYNDIRKSHDIYTCFYCKRFVYYIEPVVPPEAVVPEAPPVS